MAKKWSELRERLTPEQRERAAALTEGLRLEMQLADLRRHRGLTQQDVAQGMTLDQAAISRVEHRQDLYLSTLREYVQALGGELRLVAAFPEGEIALHLK